MATVAEKLQLTLNSKNSIKLALEKNNVSTDGKVFSDYGNLVNKAINSGWPEILYSFSSGHSHDRIMVKLPYDFKIRLEASEYDLANNRVYYTIGYEGDPIKDTEVHTCKANDAIYLSSNANSGYLHITRA